MYGNLLKNGYFMIKKNTKKWKFPEKIDFSNAALYSKKMMKNSSKNFIFDLSKTTYVHISFIGFLIDIKNSIEKNGGYLNLKASDYLKNLLNQCKLHDYFLPTFIVTQKKSA